MKLIYFVLILEKNKDFGDREQLFIGEVADHSQNFDSSSNSTWIPDSNFYEGVKSFVVPRDDLAKFESIDLTIPNESYHDEEIRELYYVDEEIELLYDDDDDGLCDVAVRASRRRERGRK